MILVDSLLLHPTPRRPVWIMRQAGRYLPSFQSIRKKYSFSEICESSDLSYEVSMLPMNTFDLDASIVFSDILIPWKALGVPLEFSGEGPKLKSPQSVEELKALKFEFDPATMTPVILKVIQQLRANLSMEKAVLGFAGAPFTMLCYLLEGSMSKDLGAMKTWMAKHPKLVHQVLKSIAEMTGEYLEAQIAAGANAVQLFDTWAGQLSPDAYREFALPYARQVFSHVTAPSIYYINGIAGLMEEVAAVGSQGLSVDWRIRLPQVKKSLPPVFALQGNLDPYDLHLPPATLRQKVFDMCESFGTGPGYIVNLGHGIVPSVPPDGVKVLVEAVREWSAQRLNIK